MAEIDHILVVSPNESDLLFLDSLKKQHANATIEIIRLVSSDNFNYETSCLSQYDRACWRVISLFDNRGLNFSRAKLYFEIRAAGFRFLNFIDKSSSFSPDLIIKDGFFLDRLSYIADSAQIGPNCRIGSRVTIGRNFKAGKHCWIGDGAVIGDDVQLLEHVTIGAGAVIAGGTRVGRLSQLVEPRRYSGHIPELSLYYWDSIGPARIYDCRK